MNWTVPALKNLPFYHSQEGHTEKESDKYNIVN